ncbi:hypothetical protein JD292_00545 [Leucobacter sp. CSA2]|uniref:Uncharacterized protein n=1 Tax=Leucobacter edaphi TaxID=2796472 RepID=A0A934UX49_9MICO|nr:DUF6338 family protein [Leucobacter edaphi]MBK0420572.1 hypothetical protein [Leucobacter edaphi]
MSLPSSYLEILIGIAILIPGLTYATVKRRYLGTREADYGTGARILDALYASLFFLILYVLLGVFFLGWRFTDLGGDALASLSSMHPQLSSVAVATLLMVIPALCAVVPAKIGFRSTKIWGKTVWLPRRKRRGRHPEPRAWEVAGARAQEQQFVRVRLEDGTYSGGLYGINSAMGAYPLARDLFLEEEYHMSPTGEFIEKVEGTNGIWISVNDNTVVEWLKAEE